MAPAGNFECLQAAIQGGADSVYFGVGRLNMRSHSANNFAIEDLSEVCRICRKAGVRTYLTLNIVLYGEDLAPMRETLDEARRAGVDAVIASDMAAILYARSIGMEVHISTQLSISNVESLRFYAQWADVVVLARELRLEQVAEISRTIEAEGIKGPSGRNVQIEMFCHGALCMAISGKCYLSLHQYNASANRGECFQLCRRAYEVKDIETGMQLKIDNQYIMSPKDLCTVRFLDKMAAAGSTVFKIEGRARSAEYVKTVTQAYREAADAIEAGTFGEQKASELYTRLETVFNRGFWDGYYQGALLGEWSEVYGNRATRTKTYIGRITNWYSRLGVAEITVETGGFRLGDHLLITGSTTGVMECDVKEIRTDHQVQEAKKGDVCSIPLVERPHRGDRVYLYQ
ncbi:MAG: U32 family peptidase [Bacteroidales bacterium]|nr:U32 family peptidase [Bacteroidales bacterium]